MHTRHTPISKGIAGGPPLSTVPTACSVHGTAPGTSAQDPRLREAGQGPSWEMREPRAADRAPPQTQSTTHARRQSTGVIPGACLLGGQGCAGGRRRALSRQDWRPGSSSKRRIVRSMGPWKCRLCLEARNGRSCKTCWTVRGPPLLISSPRSACQGAIELILSLPTLRSTE